MTERGTVVRPSQYRSLESRPEAGNPERHLDKRHQPYQSPPLGRISTSSPTPASTSGPMRRKRVLFIEEIQSDWHQEGRKKGYQGDKNHSYAEEKELKGLNAGPGRRAINQRGNQERRSSGELGDIPEQKARRSSQGVPPAPFAKTWHEFVLKRIVRWAAENGFDRIAWTTGEQQADRYFSPGPLPGSSGRRPNRRRKKGSSPSPLPQGRSQPEELYREISRRTGFRWDTDLDAGPLLYVPATGSMRWSAKISQGGF